MIFGRGRTFALAALGLVAALLAPASAGADAGDDVRSIAKRIDGMATEAASLEPFHQELITNHLEHALRSAKVMRDVAREIRQR